MKIINMIEESINNKKEIRMMISMGTCSAYTSFIPVMYEADEQSIIVYGQDNQMFEIDANVTYEENSVHFTDDHGYIMSVMTT